MAFRSIPKFTSFDEDLCKYRVAWLLQDAGAYWQPILSEFSQIAPSSKVFTAIWSGFLAGFEESFCVEQVGIIKILSLSNRTKGYAPSITYLSPRIIQPLLKYRPDVIFTTGFSIWTILALIFKRLGQWRVVIVNDGSSPGVDYRGKSFRSILRKILTKWTDGFITNSQSGKQYLISELGARTDRVIVRPYLVPHPKTYEKTLNDLLLYKCKYQHPIFIFAGNHIPRKGLQELINACILLRQLGYCNYSLIILGNGTQTEELKTFADCHGLGPQIHWIGGVPYEQVGAYFEMADVFIFPTLEDVWGMVAVEAMLFGKPILCSKWAGTAELVDDGINGFVFDPHDPKQLAQQMIQFIENNELIQEMGEQSRLVMAEHTPELVAQSLAQVVELVLSK